MTPQVSIIICTCNRADHLRQTLAAMAQVCILEYLPAELIVVDNASIDDTASVIQECRLPNMSVRYIHEPRRGQCHARNTGIAAAKGEVIVFTDDDVRPSSCWITEITAPIIAGISHAVSGTITIAPHLRRNWMEKKHFGLLAVTDASAAPFCEAVDPVDTFLIGANMAFSRQVLDKVPAFDSELGPGALGFADDVLFTFQVRNSGFKIISAPNAVVEHHFDQSRLTRSSFIDRVEKEGKSAAYLMHHWHHRKISFTAIRLAKHIAQLAWWRALHSSRQPNMEGCPEPEMQLCQEVAFYKHYRAEITRQRNYSLYGYNKFTK